MLIFRYHKNCLSDFVSARNIKAAKNSLDQTSDDREPLNYVVKSIRNEKDKVWTSSELLEAYKEMGGTETNSSRLISRINEFLGDEIYFFKCPGLATILMHKTKASQILNVEANNEEDEYLETQKIAKKSKGK